ncbi:MAG: hypothetical protein ACE5F7_06985, partial [Nitrospiria bacterium]
MNRLGKMLIKANLVSEKQVQEALLIQTREGGQLGRILIGLGFIDEFELLTFLGKQYGFTAVDIRNLIIDPEIVKMVPADLIKKYAILPIKRQGRTLSLAMIDPRNLTAINEVQSLTGYKVEPIITTESAINEMVHRHRDHTASSSTDQNVKTEFLDDALTENEVSSEPEKTQALVTVDDFYKEIGDALATVDFKDEEAVSQAPQVPLKGTFLKSLQAAVLVLLIIGFVLNWNYTVELQKQHGVAKEQAKLANEHWKTAEETALLHKAALEKLRRKTRAEQERGEAQAIVQTEITAQHRKGVADAERKAWLAKVETEKKIRLANSNGLAIEAINALEVDPERSILLALQAAKET